MIITILQNLALVVGCVFVITGFTLRVLKNQTMGE
jgi:hypothetical protein